MLAAGATRRQTAQRALPVSESFGIPTGESLDRRKNDKKSCCSHVPSQRSHTAECSGYREGTLDLMVLKTLEQMGPLHGYGIARQIEQVGQQAVIVNQGTIYLCLVRLLQKRWIAARWETSENNRKRSSTRSPRPGERSSKPRPRTGSASRASSAACCMT